MTSNAQTPGLRERKKQRTRELIADTARELFLERGFDAVTVAEIAREADVDTKTVYNYFPSKPELFYHRLEEFEQAMIDAVRDREAGVSILAAFGRFVLDQQGVLGRADASDRLRAITRTIVESPTLLAHEQQVFARFTASLAEAIADETGAHPSDVTPWVVANALIGVHRSLIDYVRRETLAGTPNRKLARDVRAQAKQALAALESGLADYGIKKS
ncbi:MAG TPA: TetR family transcriptional regulator [Gaiellaceae bacterium]|nr:TetR family transcriptional regulator [Gaiellaceae bacterium]